MIINIDIHLSLSKHQLKAVFIHLGKYNFFHYTKNNIKCGKPNNLICQDSYPCKVSKYAYNKCENMRVTNLKI